MTGGHLASNLGVVELTMALHLSFDLPKDKIVWDVGHQSYTHKILTGRKDGFDTLRKFGGMSGFPKTKGERLRLPLTPVTAPRPFPQGWALPWEEMPWGRTTM